MPIYEYRCKECHQVFEEWIRHAGEEEPCQCPICKGESVRIMSNTTFVLNGGGWYVTDYGFKSKDKTGGSPAGGTAKTEPAASSAQGAASAPAAPANGGSSPQ